VSHAVLALGTAVLTASGCVWYVPALADLRAGADRPLSRRSAAASCVTGWSTAALVAALLLLAEPWWIPCAAAVAGGAAAVALRVHAAVARRAEHREAARQWRELSGTARPLPPADRSRYVVAALVTTGLTAAAATAGLAWAAGDAGGAAHRLTAVVAPAAVLTVFLLLAAACARTHRPVSAPPARRARRDGSGPP
jgi:hypothetical protein